MIETNAGKGVGGYIRVSRVDFPAECQSAADRVTYVDMLRQVRMAELVKDAALQGETITEWYDDMGISGRGKFLPRRLAFARSRRDAKEGLLRVLYARDLSRLFRNVVQQELWFVEMEDLGITVHAQDLPFASDPATRRLLRQQMGIIHEYVSSRMGSLMRERMATRISNGLGMGLHRSKWGLTYDSDRKAFDLDPATADKVRLVYETYVACGGIAFRAARELNWLLATSHPRATATPHGKLWDCASVLNLLYCQTYRRIIKYGAVCLPCPERIPEVVSPELTARVDVLLLPRQQQYIAISGRRTAVQPRFTYTGLLRCGYCGAVMRARPHQERLGQHQERGGEQGPNQDAGLGLGIELALEDELSTKHEPKWVAYRCKAAAYGKGCSVNYAMQQYRLNVLIGQGLQSAFQSFRTQASPTVPLYLRGEASRILAPDVNTPVAVNACPSVSPVNACTEAYLAGGTAEALAAAATAAREKALQSLDRKRERYLELFAHGLIRDQKELEQCLARVQQERATLEFPRVPEREITNAATHIASAAEVKVLEAEFDSVWPTSWNQLLDVPKHDLLKRLRASISVRTVAHSAKKTCKTGAHRLNGGCLTLTLELPALGLVGLRALHLAESEEQLTAYWNWRGSFPRRKK